MISFALFTLCLIVILAVRQANKFGVRLVASIDDLTAALDRETASIAALAEVIATLPAPPDLQPSIDRVNTLTAQVDGLTTALGGEAPPGP